MLEDNCTSLYCSLSLPFTLQQNTGISPPDISFDSQSLPIPGNYRKPGLIHMASETRCTCYYQNFKGEKHIKIRWKSTENCLAVKLVPIRAKRWRHILQWLHFNEGPWDTKATFVDCLWGERRKTSMSSFTEVCKNVQENAQKNLV